MKMVSYAILKDKKVVPVDDVLEWAKWFEGSDRLVARTIVPSKGTVSTIFLGHNLSFMDVPLWFETMIFGGKFDGYQHRYSTYEQAEKGHQRVVQCLTNDQDPDLDNQSVTQ